MLWLVWGTHTCKAGAGDTWGLTDATVPRPPATLTALHSGLGAMGALDLCDCTNPADGSRTRVLAPSGVEPDYKWLKQANLD